MATVITSAQNERMQYDNAMASLTGAKGVSQTALKNAVLTQSFLRVITPLATTATLFNFPVLNNQTGSGLSVRPDEQRLAQQDAFYVSKVYVYIMKASSATAINWVPNTYPNTVTYPTGAASLYAFYNGKLTVIINNSVIVPAYPMSQFLQVPQTQLTAAANSPIDMFDGTLMQPWEPNVVFVGTYNSQIQIILPGNIGTIDANTFAVVECQGVLAQNVALGAPA